MKNTYTESEIKVLNGYINFHNTESQCVFPDCLSREAGIPMEKLRGILSSLVKKNAMYIDVDEGSLISLLDGDYRNQLEEW